METGKVDKISAAGTEIPLFEKLGFSTLEELEEDVVAEKARLKEAYTNCGKGIAQTKKGLQAIVSKGASNYNEDKAHLLMKEGLVLETEIKQLGIRHALNQKREEVLILEKHLLLLRSELKDAKRQRKEMEGEASQFREHAVIEVSSTCEHHDETANEEGPSATSKAAVGKEEGPKMNGLEYVRLGIGGTEVLAMIDSGASHNFMAERTARELGLKVVLAGAQVKTINSPPETILGIAEGVKTVLGEWSGEVDFTITRIDDYEAVLGTEFMERFGAVVVPHQKRFLIYEGRDDRPVNVPTVGMAKATPELGGMQMGDRRKRSKQVSDRRAELAERNDTVELSERWALAEGYDENDACVEDRETPMEVEYSGRCIERRNKGEPPGSLPWQSF